MQQSKSSQSSQPNPNPHHDRTGKPVVCRDVSHAQGARTTSRSQEIETRSFHEEALKHDRTEKPVVCRDACHVQGASQTRSSHASTNFGVEDETNHDRTGKPVVCRHANHERSMLNEVDIDFRIPGLPHDVLKQAEKSRVRELVKKIENHRHRQGLQQDLQQNKAYNPFSMTSKKMIQDVGNVELFELFETDPKTQCKECLLYWSQGIVHGTCGHLLKEIVANRGIIECSLDFLSIPECIIAKERLHGPQIWENARKERISSSP